MLSLVRKVGMMSLLLLAAHSPFAQDRMSSAEISYIYNQDHEFLIQYELASQGNRTKVYLKFILNSGSVKVSDYRLSYDLRSSYIDEKGVNSSVVIDTSYIIDRGFRQFVYAFEFERQDAESLLVLDVFNATRDKHFSLDIPLIREGWTPSPFLLFESDRDVPYFSPYMNKDHSIRIMDAFGNPSSYEISGIDNNKSVSLPPFDETVKEESSDIPLDTIYGVTESEVFKFHNEGYYRIISPDFEEQSRTMIVTDEFHPYFENYQDLVRPLIYISTNEEFTAMQTESDSRDAFESFVNNTISSNSRVAKDFIKSYYRRVRKSARFFSEDKEGWKTDRGMIFQVFGQPSQVFRNEGTELWVYPSTSRGRTRFIFEIVTEEGLIKYKLIRGKRYREDWMLAVTEWRAGRIIE